MTSTATLIAEAKAALAAADAAEQQEVDARKLSSDARWMAADRMAELSKTMGHREIAEAVGVSKFTVDKYVACVEKAGSARFQLFTEVYKEVRGGWGHEPRSIEGKAKAVADYVKDPEVFKRPEVIKAVSKAQQHHSRAQLPPPPVSRQPPKGLLSFTPGARADYWTKLWLQVETCREALEAALTEIRRSGLPESSSGQLVKELRRLAAVAAKVEALLTSTAIGEPAS